MARVAPAAEVPPEEVAGATSIEHYQEALFPAVFLGLERERVVGRALVAAHGPEVLALGVALPPAAVGLGPAALLWG